ncbi:hypothetical protein [Chitinimonas prasina]|uniref:hypothetical protein n=1 Tax=Chitinimonas prasina TaxID=1434937 RepID=UPI0024E1905C|nr:hypothetical protein [Chitinimonas prasina]
MSLPVTSLLASSFFRDVPAHSHGWKTTNTAEIRNRIAQRSISSKNRLDLIGPDHLVTAAIMVHACGAVRSTNTAGVTTPLRCNEA